MFDWKPIASLRLLTDRLDNSPCFAFTDTSLFPPVRRANLHRSRSRSYASACTLFGGCLHRSRSRACGYASARTLFDGCLHRSRSRARSYASACILILVGTPTWRCERLLMTSVHLVITWLSLSYAAALALVHEYSLWCISILWITPLLFIGIVSQLSLDN